MILSYFLSTILTAVQIIKCDALYGRCGKTRVNQKRVAPEDIISATASFIGFYNHARTNARLGGLSPVEFRKKNPNGTWFMTIA